MIPLRLKQQETDAISTSKTANLEIHCCLSWGESAVKKPLAIVEEALKQWGRRENYSRFPLGPFTSYQSFPVLKPAKGNGGPLTLLQGQSVGSWSQQGRGPNRKITGSKRTLDKQSYGQNQEAKCILRKMTIMIDSPLASNTQFSEKKDRKILCFFLKQLSFSYSPVKYHASQYGRLFLNVKSHIHSFTRVL